MRFQRSTFNASVRERNSHSVWIHHFGWEKYDTALRVRYFLKKDTRPLGSEIEDNISCSLFQKNISIPKKISDFYSEMFFSKNNIFASSNNFKHVLKQALLRFMYFSDSGLNRMLPFIFSKLCETDHCTLLSYMWDKWIKSSFSLVHKSSFSLFQVVQCLYFWHRSGVPSDLSNVSTDSANRFEIRTLHFPNKLCISYIWSRRCSLHNNGFQYRVIDLSGRCSIFCQCRIRRFWWNDCVDLVSTQRNCLIQANNKDIYQIFMDIFMLFSISHKQQTYHPTR